MLVSESRVSIGLQAVTEGSRPVWSSVGRATRKLDCQLEAEVAGQLCRETESEGGTANLINTLTTTTTREEEEKKRRKERQGIIYVRT